VKLVFDDLALADLESIYDWIVKDNPAAAMAVVERVFESIEHLATFPHMGHAGRDEGTQEWVVPRLRDGIGVEESARCYGSVKRKRALLLTALLPPGVFTTTLTRPAACAGVSAMIRLSL